MADEAKAVTGRPADKPPANTTMAERRAARLCSGAPVAHVADVEPDTKPEKAVAKKAAVSKGARSATSLGAGSRRTGRRTRRSGRGRGRPWR